MSSEFCDPSRSEAAVRSRLLPVGEQLEPPAPLPALFRCRYLGVPAAGAVYPSGVAVVVPDRIGLVHYSGLNLVAAPCLWDSLRACEADERVSDVVWDLCVTRLVDRAN